MRNRPNRQRKKSQARRQPLPKPAPDQDGEARSRPRSRSRLGKLLLHHGWVAKTSFVQLLQTPLSTLLTAAVIAIALSLPTGLFLLLDDLQSIVVGWQGTAQISVFMKNSVSDSEARGVADGVQRWPEIQTVRFISAQQALEEFQQQSGFGDALGILDENPLPAVLVIRPATQYLSTDKLKPVAQKLRQLPTVDLVQLDFQWIERLNTMIAIGKRGGILLAALLAVAVLVVIGNTIRLTIFNRRQEILVTKLIGATNRFIRRPFLYTGFWYGVLGAVLAGILITVLFWLLSEPVRSLAALYNSPFELTGLTLLDSVLVFATAIGLGLLGSWIAVTRHIQAIEPK
ncbi:MAG: permease-like cell division protein FtsX [Gammaproteobacteria bacterium]